jgi:hypothetical protein
LKLNKKLGREGGKATNFPSKVAKDDDEDGVMCLHPCTLIGYRVAHPTLCHCRVGGGARDLGRKFVVMVAEPPGVVEVRAGGVPVKQRDLDMLGSRVTRRQTKRQKRQQPTHNKANGRQT